MNNDLINVQNLLKQVHLQAPEDHRPDPQGPPEARVVQGCGAACQQRPAHPFRIDASDNHHLPLRAVPRSMSAATMQFFYQRNSRRAEASAYPALACGQPGAGTAQGRSLSPGGQHQTGKADYVLRLDRESTQAALSGWVTLDKPVGKSLQKMPRSKLVAR